MYLVYWLIWSCDVFLYFLGVIYVHVWVYTDCYEHFYYELISDNKVILILEFSLDFTFQNNLLYAVFYLVYEFIGKQLRI